MPLPEYAFRTVEKFLSVTACLCQNRGKSVKSIEKIASAQKSSATKISILINHKYRLLGGALQSTTPGFIRTTKVHQI